MVKTISTTTTTGQAVVYSVNSFCFVFFSVFIFCFFLLCLLVYFWFYFEKWHKMPSPRSLNSTQECKMSEFVIDFAHQKNLFAIRMENERWWRLINETIEIDGNFIAISNGLHPLKVSDLNQFCTPIEYNAVSFFNDFILLLYFFHL